MPNVAQRMRETLSHYLSRALHVTRRDGVWALIEGSVDEFRPTQSGQLCQVVSDQYAPDWADISGETRICREMTASYDDYYTILDGKASVEIEGDSPFSAIDLTVIGRSDISDFEVTAWIDDQPDPKRYRYAGTPGRWDAHGPEEVSIELDSRVSEVTLELSSEPDPGKAVRDYVSTLFNRNEQRVAGPRLSLPALRRDSSDLPPIVLVSVDTFRYDYLSCFDGLLDELGEEAVVPEQPRTHATSTKPVHATVFTGTYPGDHGYVRRGGRDWVRPIDPDLTTLGELLTDQGYKCSGLVSHQNLDANRGFARGFHRYQLRDMDWATREYDAGTNVDTLRRWIDRDTRHTGTGLCYFLHLFDAHLPYFPPDPLVHGYYMDQSLVEEFKERSRSEGAPPGCPIDYLTVYRGNRGAGEGFDVDTVQEWYRQSLNYVSGQLVRLVKCLKDKDIFEEALVVIMGDHGEEFFERGFATHQTLYDAVIRPGVIVKPPADRDLHVPDQLDLIDLFPTVADLLDVAVPEQCLGVPWSSDSGGRPRIAERIWPDWYGISIEIEGMKGIFTFEEAFPDRPNSSQLAAGPAQTEFYDVTAVQSGDFREVSIDQDIEERMFDEVAGILNREVDPTSERVAEATSDVVERLEELGYR